MNDFYNQTFDAENFKLSAEGSYEFVECHFNGVDLQGYNLSRMKFIDCQFEGSNLSNLSAKNTTMRDVTFKTCKLIGVNWSDASGFNSITFSGCILDYSVFQAMNLRGIKFLDCKMCEVDFYEAQLINAELSDCLLRGTTFNKASLHGADLRGSKEYSIDVKQTNVKKARFSLPEALSLLASLDVIID